MHLMLSVILLAQWGKPISEYAFTCVGWQVTLCDVLWQVTY